MHKLLIISLLIFSLPGETQTSAEKRSMFETIRLQDGSELKLDTNVTRLSDNGQFRVTAKNRLDPLVINQMHEWLLHIEDKNGKSIEMAQVHIDGGMPQHNHGLPTAPRVTENLGEGLYLIEGIRFNMGGWWEIRFNITVQDKTDTVVFNRILH